MKTNYVLVDFENVQPDNLDLLRGGPFKIKVFMGANQKRIPAEMAIALQPFGENLEYIRINGHGPNALDFHIAYYLGILAVDSSNTFFHIISKDAGFDPLIEHLKIKGVFCKRSTSVDEIPLIRFCLDSKPLEEQIELIQQRFERVSKPSTLKTLTGTIRSLFSSPPTEDRIEALIEGLQNSGVISVTGNKVKYCSTID